jgi:molecular chaperone GrpE
MRDETEREDGTPHAGPEDENGSAIGVDAEQTAEQGADGTDVEAEVGELREEIQRLNDRHLRLAAEFDNYRKRIERDRHTLVARLQADLVASLLDVIDDLERVADSGQGASAEAVVEGARLVEKKFRTILGAAGLDPVEAEGELFDPAVMEAMATVPTDDPSLDGVVADVFQRGYRFGDVLVRPARVRVHAYEPSDEGSE